eukprot:4336148-Pyramimonas_sp.AAC.1
MARSMRQGGGPALIQGIRADLRETRCMQFFLASFGRVHITRQGPSRCLPESSSHEKSGTSLKTARGKDVRV